MILLNYLNVTTVFVEGILLQLCFGGIVCSLCRKATTVRLDPDNAAIVMIQKQLESGYQAYLGLATPRCSTYLTDLASLPTVSA